MTDANRPVALITGCASGIGLATARRFAGGGFRVFATMRRAEERGQALRAEAAQKGWTLATPELDVDDDASVSGAVAGLLADTAGRLDVLVNNAAYYAFGALEDTTPAELRAQLDTNVVGLHRVTRAVLPAMRARRAGSIVNVSSAAGRVALPITGPYHMSKWAVEVYSETLRYELAPFGIRVSCIEPGPFKTELHAKERESEASQRSDSPYAAAVAVYKQRSAAMARGDVDPVVDVIWRAANAHDPKLRWPVGLTAYGAAFLRKFVPDRVYEWVVRFAFGLRRPGP